MRKMKYHCKRCGEVFEVEIMTREEANDKKMSLIPIRCPKCGSQEVRS